MFGQNTKMTKGKFYFKVDWALFFFMHNKTNLAEKKDSLET